MKPMDPLLSVLDLDLRNGISAISAGQMVMAYFPPTNPDLGTLVLDISSGELALKVRSVLSAQYPSEHRAILVRDLEAPVEELSINEIDIHVEGLAMYVPPLSSPSAFETLQGIVARLRAPEGCPWDQAQTHETLRKHMLEEAYEVLEALDAADLGALQEELGDLLLQILMHAQIAHENDHFRMADVVAGIQDKLIRRHPHVFGDLEVADVNQVLSNWEQHKTEEKNVGPLDGVPRSLPALAQSAELQDRASRVGFSWPAVDAARQKVMEELNELEAEQDASLRAVELGDLLFSIVSYARWMRLDPEAELQRACQRFRIRFGNLLDKLSGTDHMLKDLEFAEMLSLWNSTKL